MAEVYPSDSELLNMQSDGETGVEYIPTGQSPYYLHFRKLLYRLLLAVKRSNDLRVYDEGGLSIGVRSGKFWLGTSLISYGDSSGNILADNKANIYIYLNSGGGLVINEYSGFPNMEIVPHIRLAIATTSGGDITSITDCRAGHNFAVPYEAGGVKKKIEGHTSNDSLMLAESGSVHTNLGAAGTITLTLPTSASAGTTFTFAAQVAHELRVDPGTAAIRDSCGQAANKYKSASAIGASIQVVADANGDWAVISKNGTWTEEA